MEKATSKNAYSLAAKVVECMAERTHIYEHNPFHMAVWTMIRFCELCDTMTDPLQQLQMPTILRSLLWAKDYAHQLRRTDKSAEASTRMLCCLLHFASTECNATEIQLKELWGGAFASLLLPEKSDGSRPPAFTQTANVIQCVVKAWPHADPEWPEEIKALSDIYHKRANDTQMELLWEHYLSLLIDQDKDSGPIKAEFIPGIFVSASHIEIALQEYLLTRNCMIRRCKEVWLHKNKLLEGLKLCASCDWKPLDLVCPLFTPWKC